MSSHPAVQAYKANKATYDADYFIGHVNNQATHNPRLVALVNTPEYRAFVALQTKNKPFKAIVEAAHELSKEDLEWLIDNMPSGYPRAIIMEVQEHKYGG